MANEEIQNEVMKCENEGFGHLFIQFNHFDKGWK